MINSGQIIGFDYGHVGFFYLVVYLKDTLVSFTCVLKKKKSGKNLDSNYFVRVVVEISSL